MMSNNKHDVKDSDIRECLDMGIPVSLIAMAMDVSRVCIYRRIDAMKRKMQYDRC